MLGMLIGAAVAAKAVSKAVDSISKSTPNSKSHEYVSDIKVGISSADLNSMDYSEAINTLIGFGFKNITAKEVREYRNNFLNRDMYGRISYISINGEKDFQKDSYFPTGAYVVVAFHVFKDSPPVIIPELEKLKQPQEPERVAVYRESSEKVIRYCEYCDGILDDSWTTCEHCGAAIK